MKAKEMLISYLSRKLEEIERLVSCWSVSDSRQFSPFRIDQNQFGGSIIVFLREDIPYKTLINRRTTN